METKGERSRGYIILGSSVNKACFRTTYVVQEYHIDGISDDVERLYLCDSIVEKDLWRFVWHDIATCKV